MLKAIIFITLSALFGYACTGQQPDSANTDSAHADKPSEQAVGPRKGTEPLMPKLSSDIPENLLRQMTEQVSQESGLNTDQVNLVRAQKATWRDGSMGCPQPNLMYTQALVEGYWVIMIAGNEEYDFRATTNGKFLRCQGQTRQAPIKYDDN